MEVVISHHCIPRTAIQSFSSVERNSPIEKSKLCAQVIEQIKKWNYRHTPKKLGSKSISFQFLKVALGSFNNRKRPTFPANKATRALCIPNVKKKPTERPKTTLLIEFNRNLALINIQSDHIKAKICQRSQT